MPFLFISTMGFVICTGTYLFLWAAAANISILDKDFWICMAVSVPLGWISTLSFSTMAMMIVAQ